MAEPADRSGTITREVAIERLAQRLHFASERFDPSDEPSWEHLREIQREFHRACVRELLHEKELLLVALS